MAKIGIIGIGVVGNAIKIGFERLGHEVICHDIKLNTNIQDVIETDLCFICVPTPSRETGECDTSIVEEVVSELLDSNYDGLMCIKSTVEPGMTKKLQNKHNTDKICFVPEFLRERTAAEDFIFNHDLCIIGTSNEEHFDLITKVHGHYPEKIVQLTECEAEFCKYFNNVYNAMMIIFANSFYELCGKFDVDYTNVKDAIVKRRNITDSYLNCREDLRGFGGLCLPKDLRALSYLAKKTETDVEFFRNLLEENKKYKTTVFDGMRREEE
jgi:UDPglucose 6-dehydrogenase